MIEKEIIEYYDWNKLTAEVERLSGKRLQDWGGRHSDLNYSTGEFPEAEFAKNRGYDWRVLNDPVDEEGNPT